MLPKLPNVQQLTKTICRILGQNASPYTLQGTNCYVLGDGQQRLMIDTSSPDRPEYVDLLREFIRDQRCQINKVIFTHWHPDHVGSAAAVQNLLWSENAEYPTLHKMPSDTNPQAPHTEGLTFHNLRDGEQVSTADGAVSVKVLHTPGHTDDHACLMYECESALFCGDLILGHGSGTFEQLVPYMKSLKLVQNLVTDGKVNVVYSAHGDVISKPQIAVNNYIQHRLHRIKQVHQSVSNYGDSGCSTAQLVSSVYYDVTDPSLLLGAERNLRRALKYLVDEGSVISVGEDGDDDCWKCVKRLQDSDSSDGMGNHKL